MPNFSSDGNEYLEEWKAARDTLNNFDERLHDLRKYGFTFLTALLTADSILLPGSMPALAGKAVPDPVKFAVLVVTLVLVVALQLMDRNYQVFQQAAASRARVLERTMNLELTDVISIRYAFGHVRWYVKGLYSAFIVGIVILASAIAYVDHPDMVILTLFTTAVLMTLLITLLTERFDLHLPYGDWDWTIDNLRCQVGDKVGITLTNLIGKEIRFKQSQILWEIKDEDGKPVKGKREQLTAELTIPAFDSHTWLLNTKGVTPGIYRVWRLVSEKGEEKLKPLVRKINLADRHVLG